MIKNIISTVKTIIVVTVLLIITEWEVIKFSRGHSTCKVNDVPGEALV